AVSGGRCAVRRYGHPEWCGRGHHCGLGEHRSLPVVAEMEHIGRVVMTRVLGRDGRERMEITGSAFLADTEPVARHQLHSTLPGLARCLPRPATAAGAGRAAQPTPRAPRPAAQPTPRPRRAVRAPPAPPIKDKLIAREIKPGELLLDRRKWGTDRRT